MKRSIYIMIGTLLLCLYRQHAAGQSRFYSLTTSLKEITIKESLPGMSVILVNANHIIYKRSFGYADVAKKRHYTSRSTQNIGSVSKTFIAVALMKAIELGYFNLETDINTILPFKVQNPKYPNSIITVRELSNHSSSILDNPAIYPDTYQFDEDFAAYDTAAYKTLQNLGYRKQVSDAPLKTFLKDYLSIKGKYYSLNNFGSIAPGGSSRYSNIASALAAYLIEVQSGVSYAEFTEKYILTPLRMYNSGWFLNAKELNHYAKPYYDLVASFPFYHYITYPDGGLRSNTADLSKYLIALIKGYNGDQSLLSRQSYQTMFSPQFSKDHPPEGVNLLHRNKGIFWNLYTNGTIGHDGDDPGVSSFLFFNTKTGKGGIFLCNKYLPDKTQIINVLVQATN